MCDSCGCSPCVACGAPVEDGLCAVCGEKPDYCTCEPLDETVGDEDEYEDDEDGEEEEDDDYDDDDEEEDEDDDDEDW